MKSNVNRRRFIQSTVIGTTAAIIGSSVKGNTVINSREEGTIIKRRLGKTDIELPIVSFGVMRSDNAPLIKSAFDTGFLHFDTAHSYMEGRNETMLGEIFKNIPRNSFVISTKVAPDDMNRSGQLGPGATKESILSKFELSLQRLQLKYVDILYFHGVSTRDAAMAPQMMEAFDQIKKQGKARYIGISTHMNEPDMVQMAMDSNFYDVVLTAINFKQSYVAQLKEKIALAAAKGIGIIAMKPMAGGFMDKERKRPINCSGALKWVLQDKNIHTSIPGIVTFDQMNQNFAVAKNLEMTEEEKSNIEEAKLVAGLYCEGCRECLPQCKKQLPVNEYMRAYMYTYGYRHYENALAVLDGINASSNPCSDCNGCSVNCPKGFVVSERMQDVSRLSDVPRELIV